MNIKAIFDEIAAEPGTNKKMEILAKYKDNQLLKDVLYLANSGRVKFYLKQIPEYSRKAIFFEDSLLNPPTITLEEAISYLSLLSNRTKTGHSAIEFLSQILRSLEQDDAYIIERIIEKDCKIGMGTSNMNKVFPKLIEDTYYMGAVPFNEKKIKNIFLGGKQGISEVKADGRFCNVTIADGVVEMVSRQGEQTLIGDALLLKEFSAFPDCVLNGELVIDGIKRETSNGLMTSIIDINKKLLSDDPKENKKAQESITKMLKRHGFVSSELLDNIRFIVWDILDLNEYATNICVVKRIDRLNKLKSVIQTQNPTMISVVEHKFVSSYEEALAHFAEMLERGEEGTILKSMDGVWRDGKHAYQIKMKVEFDLDLVIVGFNYGNKGTKNENVISSVNCETSCGKLKAKAQGIKEEIMDYITENQSKLLGTIAEVKCNGLSSNQNGGFSVLYPTLKAFRDDKNTSNSYDECVDIDAAAKGISKAIKAI